MSKPTMLAALAVLTAASLSWSAFAADDAALEKELTSVIASQSLPCGKIVKISTQAERDYLVACKDGSNYQIIANAQGKLAAHRLGAKIH